MFYRYVPPHVQIFEKDQEYVCTCVCMRTYAQYLSLAAKS